MKTLIIGFSRARWKTLFGLRIVPPFFSWLIMAVIRRPYSHAFWMWDVSSPANDGTTFQCSYEASGTDVKFLGPAAITDREVLVKGYKIMVDPGKHKEFMRLCMFHAFDPYSILKVAGVGWVKLVYWITLGKVSVKNPFSNSQFTWFCNDLAFYLLNQILGLELGLEKVDMDQGGPELLERILDGLVSSGKLQAEIIDFTKSA